MFIKKIFLLLSFGFLAACVNNGPEWGTEWGDAEPEPTPTAIDSGVYYYNEYDGYDAPVWQPQYSAPAKTIAVLLPMSGPNKELGVGIQHSIEIAFLQKAPRDVLVSFHDLSGDRNKKAETIDFVLSKNPDLILGPVFADDALLVRDMKPKELPVLSFTSDPTALGGGVLSMALMPSQSVEESVRQAANDGNKNMIVLAPDTPSGYIMANASISAAEYHGVRIMGLKFYKEGNPDSIKNAASIASQYELRAAANDKAKEILSDILIKEKLSAPEIAGVSAQLDALNKKETMGGIPFDSVLLLGGGADSTALASFLRYYDVSAKDAKIYGTALWDSSESIASDMTLSGAKYTALPFANAEYRILYLDVEGAAPQRIDSFGYDAAMLAINALQSSRGAAAYLLDPSGYRGLDGLVRLRPNGMNERALQTLQLNGTGTAAVVGGSARNFLTPLYQAPAPFTRKPKELEFVGLNINPMDYIKIPEHLRNKYRAKTYGQAKIPAPAAEPVIVLSADDSEPVYSDDFQPAALDTVDRRLIDSVEIEE